MEEGGLFTQMKLGVQGLVSGTAAPAAVQRDMGPAAAEAPAAQ